MPGPLDTNATLNTIVVGGLLEAPALAANLSFLTAAALAGVPVTTDLYGPGTHSWPYWQREFQRSWPVSRGRTRRTRELSVGRPGIPAPMRGSHLPGRRLTGRPYARAPDGAAAAGAGAVPGCRRR